MGYYQIETGTCNGRGFSGADPNGFLAKFVTWVVKPIGSGGPGWFIIDDQSALGTDPYIVVSDVAAPVVNDYNTGQSGNAPKFLRLTLETAQPGRVYMRPYLWWDAVSHTGQARWFNGFVATLDDSDFVYDFRGGQECLIIQSRVGTDWDNFVLDDFLGDPNLLEPVTKVGVLAGGITAGSDVVVTLGAGEAVNFTQDKFYYIFDFDGHTWVDYVKVTNVNPGADQITLELVNEDYPAGAVVSSYAHRYYCMANWNYSRKSSIPVWSYNGNAVSLSTGTSQHTAACWLDILEKAIGVMSPDDQNIWAMHKMQIVERYPQTGFNDDLNRSYGLTQNAYVSAKGNMARGQDGITLNSVDWLFFQQHNEMCTDSSESGVAVLLRDTIDTP